MTRDEILAMEPGRELDALIAEKALEPREQVKWFAEQMEITLRRNDHKSGWSECSNKWLLTRTREETYELEQVLDYQYRCLIKDPETIIREATDIANFAMMIADNARRSLVE